MIKTAKDSFNKKLHKTACDVTRLNYRQDNFEVKFGSKLCEQEAELSGISRKLEEMKSHVGELHKIPRWKEWAINGKDIQNRLREHYETCETTFFPIDWSDDCLKALNDLYVQLELVEVEKFESSRQTSKLDHASCDIYDSFKTHKDCNDPRRILWVGEAGVGKTSSCEKLAVDFSKNFDEFAEKFPGSYLLIFLRCRELKGQLLRNVSELLSLPVSGEHERSLLEWLQNNSSKLFFLIDGLDELRYHNKELESLLKGDLFKGARVIVTSRREGLKGRQRYFDSIFCIRGFNKFGVYQFVEKYFETFSKLERRVQLAKSLHAKLEQNSHLSDLSEIPLCLLILCVIWEEHGGILPEKLAVLYDSFLNCMIDRYLSKYTDSYQCEEDIRSYVISILSRLAYTTLKSNVSYFEQHDLTKVIGTIPGLKETVGISLISRIGLVSLDTSGSKLSRCCYQFFHKSFQEFFCSLYVKQNITNPTSKDLLCQSHEYSWLLELTPSTSMGVSWSYPLFVRFLCGILNDDEFQGLFQVVLEKAFTLQSCGWVMDLNELSGLICDIDPKCLLHFADLIGDALPSNIHLDKFRGKILDMTSGPLKHWAFTKRNGGIQLTSNDLSSFTAEELMGLEALMMNQSSKVKHLTIKLNDSSPIPTDAMGTIAKIWWKGCSLTMLVIKCYTTAAIASTDL